jgi:hypothetical protein
MKKTSKDSKREPHQVTLTITEKKVAPKHKRFENKKKREQLTVLRT